MFLTMQELKFDLSRNMRWRKYGNFWSWYVSGITSPL